VLGIVAGLVSGQIRQRVTHSLHTLEERNRVISVFGQHVSPTVVDKLLVEREGEDLTEMRYVCVMFLDIRNFTTFSERTKPDMVITYLNTLFASMIEIINDNHGIINKFLGDGFMAVFGAPLSNGEDCRNAVSAAHKILAHVNRLVEKQAIPPTNIGIGLHAGEAITGNIGSSLRKEYTVIGDVVNVASRIEQLNKQFGSHLLISDVVWNALGERKEEPAESLQPLMLKGRIEPVQIWKLA
jgi:adenylate cyclase